MVGGFLGSPIFDDHFPVEAVFEDKNSFYLPLSTFISVICLVLYSELQRKRSCKSKSVENMETEFSRSDLICWLANSANGTN